MTHVCFCLIDSVKNIYESKLLRSWNTIGRKLQSGCLVLKLLAIWAARLSFSVIREWTLTYISPTHDSERLDFFVFYTFFLTISFMLTLRNEKSVHISRINLRYWWFFNLLKSHFFNLLLKFSANFYTGTIVCLTKYLHNLLQKIIGDQIIKNLLTQTPTDSFLWILRCFLYQYLWQEVFCSNIQNQK